MNNLFYSDKMTTEEVILIDQEASHCSQVLRKKQGDLIHVIDGEGGLYECKIINVNKKEVRCEVVAYELHENTENLTIAVAPTKNRDRLEWMVEKLVEIGVKSILLLETKNTERSRTNLERLNKKILSAVKQSLRYYIPKLSQVKFEDLIHQNFNGVKRIAHCENTMKSTVLAPKSEKQLILIGPEGDFTASEIDAALEAGFEALDLGQARLRTETAAVVAASRVI